MLANEWTNLPVDKKQQYLDAAEQDRERYTREYNAYKQTEAYKLFTQQQNEKKLKESKEELKQTVSIVLDKFGFERKFSECRSGSACSHQGNPRHGFGNFDIPIFTEEFLDHNKNEGFRVEAIAEV
jgi:hypothetical protein